ncbi:hypothetical protein [Catellatospora tritici]|uniref:hypothetical protein n=1 Tax=Catellatospora tritici TaxID=2851566 RepID=UPI001C2DAB82|nr:hypothetical protein [Catellatospora tritici]MBV1849263.1 hypothetical protein [Catellatospora tritici]
MTIQNPASGIVDLDARFQSDQALLIVTSAPGPERESLSIPFREAKVLRLDEHGDIDVADRYDTIVLQVDRYSAALVDTVVRAVRPGGWVVAALSHDSAPVLAGLLAPRVLTWSGMAMLGDRFCAVLAAVPAAAGTADVGGQVMTAWMAYELGSVMQARLAEVEQVLADQVELRRLSEQALLRHIAGLALKLEQEQERTQGLRLVQTVLQSNLPGRAILSALRPVRNAARSGKTVAGQVRRRIKRH